MEREVLDMRTIVIRILCHPFIRLEKDEWSGDGYDFEFNEVFDALLDVF